MDGTNAHVLTNQYQAFLEWSTVITSRHFVYWLHIISKKIESLVCDIQDKAKVIETNTISRCIHHEIHQGIQSELCTKQTIRFEEWVESICTSCF